ncbi:hypothetical protein CWC25_21290 [Pseudoalteromonas sp. S4389]|jgi:hypothetical protein|nr:hypothetical protein CWC25_21290 [Pseudoalteromonas sp. S4389]|tara:strand:- start:301 stop:1098 length:798 start_codon:yes stop_codon:yes gene_type:complete
MKKLKDFCMNKFAILFGLSFILPSKVIAVTGGGDQGGPAYESWQGLIIKDENRCSAYDKKADYEYDQNVEDAIVASMNGQVYGPYTGSYFESDSETDIEHIVATSEAHDSGLCSAPVSIRKAFASDLLNLTLASPKVNRCSKTGKCGFDAGEWLPEKNKCWFVNRIVQVKQKYKLSIDLNEYHALSSVLMNCTSTDMVYHSKVKSLQPTTYDTSYPTGALSIYDDNQNGKISCKEARNHKITPVYSGHPAYPYMNDRDGDGVVCR